MRVTGVMDGESVEMENGELTGAEGGESEEE